MRYRVGVTIPAGTTKADPVLVELDLEYGYITEVEMLFPAGHAGLTFLQIYHQSRQIFPLTPGEAFRGDDHQIQFNERFPILEVPYAVIIKGWGPSTVYDHEVFVSLTIEAASPAVYGDWTPVMLPGGM